MPVKFKIDQIALCPVDPDKAKELLCELGLDDWFLDTVVAEGTVFGVDGSNQANLSFNYQSGDGKFDGKSLELEVLNYTSGPNWMSRFPNTVSHLGMHCSEEELSEFSLVFKKFGIDIAQEVHTKSHTNPHIKDTRRYHYVIFNTRPILGVDLKFICRKDGDYSEK